MGKYCLRMIIQNFIKIDYKYFFSTMTILQLVYDTSK